MHIKEQTFQDFLNGNLEPDILVETLEHIAGCDYCTGLMETMADSERLKAPGYLKDQMLERTQKLDIQAVRQVKETSKKMSLLFYTLRTTTAVAGALLLLFMVSWIDNREIEIPKMEMPKQVTLKVSERLSKGGDKAVDFINDFTDRIINGGMKK